jgi:UDP-N-acetylglucosamine diphosphorylase/glucosamine-1-phosphate N-acetyltransferase
MRVCLFEDSGVSDLEPLSLTRPVFELLCGQTSLAAKHCRAFAPCDLGVLIRPPLVSLYQLHRDRLPVNDLAWLRAGPTVLVNGRWLPPEGTVVDASRPAVGLIGDEVAYAVVGPDHLTYCSPNTLADCLATWKATLPARAAGGRLFRYLWEIVAHNDEQILRDWQTLAVPRAAPTHPPAVVGPDDRLVIDATARIDPQVVADTTRGPVVVGREAVIGAFTRLEGPCFIGPRTQVHGARIRAGTTLGPECRVGGEVEASIVQGYSNKYHEGFLGHAYLGEWVNLGAGTQNSDLRNDYGEVSVTVNGRRVRTGQTKVGCFLGDHAKTGLGCLLNTGAHVGIFCNLLPGGLLPRYLPSFGSCWGPALADRADLALLFETAATMMRRRGQTFTEVHAALYRALFEQTAAERRRAVQEAVGRGLRRSA